MLEFLLNINPWIYGIIISMLPVTELRAGIPVVAAAAGAKTFLDYFWVFLVCTGANLLVTPIAFIFLETLHKLLIKIKLYKKIFDKVVERTRRKSQKAVDKYGALGLAIFVAVPLPGTGAWAGSLAAWIFGLERKKAFISISLGVVAAGILVTLIAAGILNGISWMLG